MQYDVFISYSRKDSEVANKIYDTLSSAGLSCFIDLNGISGGTDFPSVLAQAIMGSKLMLLVASRNCYASAYTMKEITFALNNKGNNFIIPFIIDDSELPKNLEFLFSNINCRYLSSRYRIEKELLKDVLNRLENPHAGETLVQQSQRQVKKVVTIIAIIIGVAILGVGAIAFVRQRQQQRAQIQANKDRQVCLNYIAKAQVLLSRADSLRNTQMDTATFEEELECLDDASSAIHNADLILVQYLQDSSFSSDFRGVSTTEIHQAIENKRDSMGQAWMNLVQAFYKIYLMSRDDEDLNTVKEYANNASVFQPQDSLIIMIKEL